MLMAISAWFVTLLCVWADAASAHVSERALVLILPTDIYIRFGVAAVAVTVVLTVFVPPSVFRLLVGQTFRIREALPANPVQGIFSLIGLLCLIALIAVGTAGPRDPLQNLLPLTVFTVWWIFLPLLQGLFGDIWGWINPWSGVVRLVFQGRQLSILPSWLGVWPAVISYFLASVYTLTDLAPDDPDRLARTITCYWLFTFGMCGVFGKDWLHRGEGFTVFFDFLARLAVLQRRPFGLQFPGEVILSQRSETTSVAIFALVMLALGSFDGLNETFWWMSQLGINPLEFPGRSAIAWPNRLGMLAAVFLLTGCFAVCVWAGTELINERQAFKSLFCRLALSLLPIALGYHMAHFLTSSLVNLQYFLAALNDPFDTGAALLGINNFYITTSFFNQHHTVKAIWLTQAGTIVLAHIIAVLLSHLIALQAFGKHRLAVLSQLPVAGFMLLYTLFGLWLLASPVAF